MHAKDNALSDFKKPLIFCFFYNLPITFNDSYFIASQIREEMMKKKIFSITFVYWNRLLLAMMIY